LTQPKKFKNTIQGKLLIIFGLVLFLSLISWMINRSAFTEISKVIQQLSKPNEKQIELDKLNQQLSQFINSQRKEALKNQKRISDEYVQKVEEIANNLDTLKSLFEEEPDQLNRIVFLDSIFEVQNDVFEKYIRTRYYYLNSNIRGAELDSLNEDIRSGNISVDSNIVSWEQTTKTYTLLPPIKIPSTENTDKRSLRRNRNQTPEPAFTELQLVLEEQKDVKVDSSSTTPTSDSLINRITSSMSKVDNVQRSKINFLQNQERVLMSNNELLIDQFLEVLNQVKGDERIRTQLNTTKSTEIANKTVNFTKKLSIAFFVIAFLLFLLIIWDMARTNRYRKALEIAKAQAEYHSMAKQQFLSNMSHEMRTPLQSIIGFSEVIKAESSSPHIDALQKSSNHLLSVINEMLDYSKIISGKFSFKNEPFRITEIFEELDEIFSWDCHKKGLEWNFEQNDLIPNHLTVIGDRYRMKQILYNLLGNAIKYTEKGSIKLRIDAEIFAKNFDLQLIVSDTGQGISANKLAFIFEEYEQAGVDHTSGTGLGLNIVKQLVDGMNGTITVESEVGKGSVFTVNLSLPITEPKLIETIEVIEQEKIHFSGAVWLVDDDELILQLCSHILSQEKIEHRCFSSAESLLNEEWDENVQLILSDFRLPGMNGIELGKRIRAKHPELKMIALTAQVLPEEQQEILESGFNDLLIKPFKKDELLELIKNYAPNIQRYEFNLNSLKSMIDDPTDLKEIIEQFKADTRTDIALLTQLIEENVDSESILLIVHRLAGRTDQFGGHLISKQLREFENRGRGFDGITAEMLERLKLQMERLLESLNDLN